MESSGTVSSLAVIGFWSGLLGCVLLMIDGPLYRAHVLDLGTALRIVIPAALFLGVIAVLLSVIGLVRSGSKGDGGCRPGSGRDRRWHAAQKHQYRAALSHSRCKH